MENNQPLVSIAIATYQNEAFIGECIESILAQTYQHIEIIIADDGSTDNSPGIIKSYAAGNKNIKPLFAPFNKGIAENLNAAIEHCNGQYICLIAGDDIMYPQKIERQVAFLENNKEYDLCFHNIEVYDEDTKTVLFQWLDKYLPTRNPKDALFLTNWFFKKEKRRTPSGSWFGRAVYIKNGHNDWRTRSSHEFIFTMNMLAAKPEGKWHTLPEVLGMYRMHSQGLSRYTGDWAKFAEEANLSFTLARIKFPQYIKAINNEEAYWWFLQLLYNQVPDKYGKVFLWEFLRKHGVIKFIYLYCCKLYLSNQLQSIRKWVKGSGKTAKNSEQ